jgi:ABC-type microcin C transport system duplicated ATPase subunit YejF
MGQDITKLGNAAIKKIEKEIQIIFQDPTTSLNPRIPR